MTTQPRTAAGRALNARFPVRLHDGTVDYDPPFLDDILAIEAEAARREAGLREALAGVVEALQEWRDSEITFPGRRLSKALDKARFLLHHDNAGTAER